MGKHAEVYDVEMLALLSGLETAIEFQLAAGREQKTVKSHTIRQQHIFGCFNNKRETGIAEVCGNRNKLLDENRRASIEVPWVPRYMDIAGSDRADEIAKEETELESATETTAMAKLHRQLRDNVKVEWVTEWAWKPMTGRYAIADRISPSLAGSHAFRTLNRHTLGMVTQARTGYE